MLVHAFHGLKSACSLMGCPSTIGATYVSIFHRAYTCGIVVIPDTLFSVKHLLSISSSQLYKVGPRLFICFTSILSMPAAFLFLGAAIPFLYSSSENVYTSVTSPAASVIRVLRFARHGSLTVDEYLLVKWWDY